MKLAQGQRKQLAEILGNIASAWFIAGIISPLFSKPTLTDVITYALLGILMTGFFTYASLSLMKGIRI